MSHLEPVPNVSELFAVLGFTPEEAAREAGCHPSTVYRWKKRQRLPKSVDRLFRQMAKEKRRQREGRFTFIDLFSGIGGMRLAAESMGGKCVFSCERDRWARHTYIRNFPETAASDEGVERIFPTDINAIEPHAVPDHDLLIAGFPCQPFSIAGVSKKNALGRPHGFECEDQGNLFFRIRDILLAKRPASFLLENVKNLERHDKGQTFGVIRQTLEEELGYHITYQVVDAKPWVPQHRERILIAGFREPTRFSFDALERPAQKQWPKLREILHRPSEVAENPYTIQERGRSRVDRRYTLTDHLWKYLQDYKRKHEAAGNGFGFGLVKASDTARTLSARYFKDGSEILISQGDKKNPRRLTPRECARLMGFPKDFRIEVSDTQAYKQFGNSVVVPVIQQALVLMLPHILRIAEGEQLDLLNPAVNG
jgi:DNA (cytosine-5)-methyltransferase 1